MRCVPHADCTSGAPSWRSLRAGCRNRLGVAARGPVLFEPEELIDIGMHLHANLFARLEHIRTSCMFAVQRS